jgi:hypothetical protein
MLPAMHRIEGIRSRFAHHFPDVLLSLDKIAYVENGDDYVCGVLVEESQTTVVVRCIGIVRKKPIDYNFTIQSDWNEVVTSVNLHFSHPAAVDVVLEPHEEHVVARPSSLDLGRAAGCIGLAGGKSAYECWYRCKKDKQCWKDCAKEKGVTLGLEILGCLAL